jgi:hypothetical protein
MERQRLDYVLPPCTEYLEHILHKYFIMFTISEFFSLLFLERSSCSWVLVILFLHLTPVLLLGRELSLTESIFPEGVEEEGDTEVQRNVSPQQCARRRLE